MLLREIKSIYHKELDEIYGKEEVDSFFYILIDHYLGLERFILALQPELIISKSEEQPLFKALSQLKLCKPIQHITGLAHFMDMDFYVNETVLIPRPETEELIQWVMNYLESRRSQHLRILDIGTGSGCIAISLAKNIPDAKVFALDISKKALEVAQSNAKLNKVDISFLQTDILEERPLLGNSTIFRSKFDVMVSNPPYVREIEKQEMHANVLAHEPGRALFVPDDNPLVFYEAIANFADKNLIENGSLFVEINQYLGKENQALFKAHEFSAIELKKDMFGNDRMIHCKK
ncbi:peptide chain release factor N(5)-glutamine methyltransferase [Costertonia aggregata]|uniref:peptide chain release factor N(5)-glutamine methyltransferase n=1 Tax=Costertonia aggregata TaxID=343403 RepID=A0A7H9AJZ3_9FLAO|nr:peptide chain release factor N(5)-glutamine methyltransferase [Costertonia aggregata]QLG43861.1 peptide chain release factor N(5)-glutamine methyltransferase [Costertonia aggregata]